MEEKRKKFGVELKPSLHKRLKQRALDMDRSLWEITDEAIRGYLDGVKDAPEEDPELAKVRYIFDHGADDDVAGLKTNISAFYRLAASNPRPAGKSRRKRA